MLFRKLVLNNLRPLKRGTLEIVLPGGEVERFGGVFDGVKARMEIKDDKFFRRCVLFGPIGFAESYMDGEWETPDLTRLLAWFILNSEDAPALKTEGGKSRPSGLDLLSIYNRLLHRRRPNSLRMARSNIREHYDLSNDFFRLWLDPTMTYSSAYYDPPDLTLEQAQIEKYDQLCQKLRLGPADEVLEIGSGWGGFSIHAASKYGCRITTLTISEQQYEEASARIKKAGLSDRIEILLADYRTMTGRFDKIVSIEMIEAVGDRYLDAYFGKCQELLKPQGLLALQMITCPDRQFRILRDGVDFIQKHIFPGSLLVCLARVTQAINNTGDLNLLAWEDMAPFYAKTLRVWDENFHAKLAEVRALGFDERFIRKWHYYLCYCEAAFGTRHISVVQAVWSRPNNLSLHSPAYDLVP